MRRINVVTGYIYDKVNKVSYYMKVENANQRLLEENSRLHNRSIESFHSLKKQFDVVKDTIRITGDTLNIIQQYTYTTARVINNTTNRKYNFMTLNKGKLHGIKENMGVVSSDGIVGIVKDVSDHFSTAVSLLNVRLGISAKLKKNNYPGLIHMKYLLWKYLLKCHSN